MPQADEFVPQFCGSLRAFKMGMAPSPLHCGMQSASSLNGEETLLNKGDNPRLSLADAAGGSSRFSSISSAECSNIRANLPMLMVCY